MPPIKEEHPDIGSGRVGLLVMEGQLLTKGHMRLLTAMAGDCDIGIVGLGSCNKSKIPGHPFDFVQRKTMIEAVYGNIFRFIQLNDIDAVETSTWVDYVLSRTKSGLPEPTDCYVGSEIEARWYRDHFQVEGRRLHIVDRTKSDIPSARDLRTLVEVRDPSWQEHVPARIWNFVERNYPPSLRIAVEAGTAPAAEDYPVGTRLKLKGSELLELKDDGAWRPLKTFDEKGAYAARAREERGQ
jgi:nicotinamide mononucleotide adenylyltransferase